MKASWPRRDRERDLHRRLADHPHHGPPADRQARREGDGAAVVLNGAIVTGTGLMVMAGIVLGLYAISHK